MVTLHSPPMLYRLKHSSACKLTFRVITLLLILSLRHTTHKTYGKKYNFGQMLWQKAGSSPGVTKQKRSSSERHECAWSISQISAHLVFIFSSGPNFLNLLKICVIFKLLGITEIIQVHRWGVVNIDNVTIWLVVAAARCPGSRQTERCSSAEHTRTWCPWKYESQKKYEEELCLQRKAIIKCRNVHSQTVQCPCCTHIYVDVHKLNGISLISLHLRKAFSYYTKWSVRASVCVCVCVSQHWLMESHWFTPLTRFYF